jgi:hypothetical protein
MRKIIEYDRRQKKFWEKTPHPTVSIQKEEAILGIALNNPELLFKIDPRMLAAIETYELFVSIRELSITTVAELLIAVRKTPYFEYALLLQGNYDSEHISTFNKLHMSLEDLRIKRLELLCATRKIEHIEDTHACAEIDKFYDVEIAPMLSYGRDVDVVMDAINGVVDGKYGGVIKTGIPPIDSVIEGFTWDDVVVIGARPGMGKTTFAVDLCMNMCRVNDVGILFNSLEVPSWRLVLKFLSNLSQIEEWKIRANIDGICTSNGVISAADKLRALDITRVEGCYTPKELEIKLKLVNAQRLIEGKKPIGIVMQDYLQIKNSDNTIIQKQIVDDVLREEVRMSKKYGFIPIYLSQINRGIEQRGGTKRPAISDLKDSGNIEQVARKVLLLHRPEYYGFVEDEEGNSLVNVMEVNVAKNNNGTTKITTLKGIMLDKNTVYQTIPDIDDMSTKTTSWTQNDATLFRDSSKYIDTDNDFLI